MSYMNSNSWGYNSPNQMTANQVDFLAEKIEFGIDMINNHLLSLDSISKELNAISNAQTPPKPEQLRTLSIRIDTCSKQITDSLNKLKEMTKEIDVVTDKIQQNPSW